MGPADLSNKMLMYHSITIKKSLGRKTATLAAYVAQFRVLDKSQIFLIKKKNVISCLFLQKVKKIKEKLILFKTTNNFQKPLPNKITFLN